MTGFLWFVIGGMGGFALHAFLVRRYLKEIENELLDLAKELEALEDKT